jgi:hypothetical protein
MQRMGDILVFDDNSSSPDQPGTAGHQTAAQFTPSGGRSARLFVECYEMSLRGARGIAVRQHESGYSAYVGYEGRQRWAGQLFGDVQDAQAWCERELVARTSS